MIAPSDLCPEDLREWGRRMREELKAEKRRH